jgi:hypothetical protein
LDEGDEGEEEDEEDGVEAEGGVDVASRKNKIW